MDLGRIQEALRREKLDGWLFFDHHHRDPLAYRILALDAGLHVTRRWYYLIPAQGEPVGIVHNVESHVIDRLPGEKLHYSGWREQHSRLENLLRDKRRIAMQYSPRCAVPYVAMVDAGTVELIRNFGVEIATSAELIQEFEACLTDAQFETHLEAGRRVDKIREGAFRLIGERLSAGIDELTVRGWILDSFEAAGMITDHGPIVAVNEHAGDPHYEPKADSNARIGPGDLVLLDMWAKLVQPGSVYYDITWTGLCGSPPDQVRNVFEIVRDARDRAVETVSTGIAAGRELRGVEVDDAARQFIEASGFGDRFVHRTGHSIGEEVHGTGANMDNLETHDDRRILSGALFSIEPGIYLPKFGIRSEVNVFVNGKMARTTGEVQRELVRIQ